MRIVKENQDYKRALVQESRFIEISGNWYELLSVYIDVITEKVIMNMNLGYFNEESEFVKEQKYRAIIENRGGRYKNIKEKLSLDKKFRVKTSYSIADENSVASFTENNKRIKNFKVVDGHTVEFRKLKSSKINIKYISKEEPTDGYDRFMREIIGKNTVANNIIASIKKSESLGDIKYEAK